VPGVTAQCLGDASKTMIHVTGKEVKNTKKMLEFDELKQNEVFTLKLKNYFWVRACFSF
jgi:hypothetical protein